MRIEQLRYFLEVARWGSIRKASERLYIAQQSLSQSVKKLETEMGVPLYVRALSGVTLTREGEAVRDFAEAVLREQEKLEARMAMIANEREEEKLEGELNIYAFGVFSYYLLPDVLVAFRKRHPHVKLNNFMADYQIIDDILDRGWGPEDLGMVVLSDVEETLRSDFMGHADIVFAPLCKGEYRFYCAADHPLAKKRSVTLDEALAYPIVYHGISGFENGTLYRILCQHGQCVEDVQMDVMPVHTCLNMITQGQSLGFLNEYLYEGVCAAGLPGSDKLVALPLDMQLPCVLGVLHGREMSPQAVRFLEVLDEKMKR